MKELKVAVLGAGQGGHALAADLSLQGHYVNIYEHPRFEQQNLDPIRKQGGIEIYSAPGAKVQLPRTGLARIKGKITSNMAEVVKGEWRVVKVPRRGVGRAAEA